ncbi:tail protein [Staphylococcus phage SAP3]|nr:tail protein [Staphylococcus phage SAP3]
MIYKNKDIKAEINEQGVDIGNIGANFYTKDLGTASIRISINWKGSVLDLSKTTLKPKLDLFCEDGSIFVNESVEIISQVNGLIQYNISKDVIKHVGKVTGKLFLVNDDESIHVVTFHFNISDSGIDSVVTKEVSVTLIDDTVRRIIQENAIQLLGDDFESRLNTDVIEHLNSNPDLFKGAKGDTGATGPKGEKGERGEQGPQGEQGIKGEDADTSILDDAKGSFNTLNERLESLEYYINPSDFGASPDADWQTNRDAFQKANDIVYSNGGGVINVKPGTYIVKGVQLNSNVHLNLDSVTLKHPDGTSPSLLASKVFNTTLPSITSGNTITIDGLPEDSKDCVIAIEGVGGISNTQQTNLSSSINIDAVSIPVTTSDTKFPANGVLRVGNELIKYSSISNNTVSVSERGAFGTVATSHESGEAIGLANVHYSEITEVSGNTITLKDPITLNVSNVQCWVGSKNIKITGGTIDGNKYNGGYSSSVYGLSLPHVRFSHISNTLFKNCDQGAIILSKGAKDNIVTDCKFKDNGIYTKTSGNKGASIWLFQGCKFNKITNCTFFGSAWVAFYIDDRTSVADIFDKANTDNYISNITIDFDNKPNGYNLGFVITGSSRNLVSNGYIKGPVTGFKIEKGGQYLKAPENAENNEVSSFYIDTGQPWNVEAPGNRINNIVYSERLTTQPITEESTLIYSVSPGKGENATFGKVLFPSGTMYKPGISFESDQDTGFMKYADNTIGVVSGAEFIYLMYNTLTKIKDGYDVQLGTEKGTRIGTTPTQKIGFYGKTPIEQQSTLYNTNGYTLQQLEYEVNAIKNVLRNIGIIAQN